MNFFEAVFPTPEEKLACDEALLEDCEAGLCGEVLRFWEPAQYFVVVGYANKVESEVNLAFCQQKRIPILRRCTGGGTVLQGPGCLNYSLLLDIGQTSALHTIVAANRFILERHRAALAEVAQAPVEMQGQTDLAMSGRKFSGNAQRRKKHFLLFHGTFLLRFDISLVERALLTPSRQPAYRANRSHTEFMMNLNLPAEQVKAALVKAWNATEGPASQIGLTDRINTLVGQKYALDEWNLKF